MGAISPDKMMDKMMPTISQDRPKDGALYEDDKERRWFPSLKMALTYAHFGTRNKMSYIGIKLHKIENKMEAKQDEQK